MKKTCSVLACLLVLPAIATAQSSSQTENPPSRWGVGLGLSVSNSPYAGEGTKTTALPLLQYEGERFFLRGLTGGAHLYRSQTFGLDAIASVRTDGINATDFGAAELARNGIDRNLLEDRDNGLDLGLSGTWRTNAGDFQLSAKADVTGASEGFELTAKYSRDFTVGRGRLTPSIGVSYLSKDSANYYFGTLKEEVARGVVDYKPGAVTIPKIGLTYIHPIGQQWRLMTGVQYKFLPNKVSASPLLKADTKGEGSVVLGISRSF
ncbi:MltA-interacting protein precursor [compost metagenome]